jgi:hypothetical protein
MDTCSRLEERCGQAAVVIKPVSAHSLFKTGIFAEKAGLFAGLRLNIGKSGVQRRNGAAESPDFRPVSRISRAAWRSAALAGDAVLIAPVSNRIPCYQGI